MDLEFEILDDIETMIKVKWDSDTLRRDIELKVMERKKIFNDLTEEISRYKKKILEYKNDF